MELTNSQEEYLKTIYLIANSEKNIRVTDIAKKLNITKPSVNRAIKNLKELGLLNYKTYGDIFLTKEGEILAKTILKRQDIIKTFLVEILEVDEKQAQKESSAMKHSISEDTSKKLEEYIQKIFNIGDLDCDYDENNEKCKNCIKITVKNRKNVNN